MLIFDGSWREGDISFSPDEYVVYETVRTYDGVPFKLEEHLRRLERSADLLKLEVPRRKIIEAFDTFPYDGEHRFRIYLSSRGVFVSAEEIPPHPKSVEIVVSRWRKPPKSSVPPFLKILNQPSTILAKLEKGDRYEALMLSSEGLLAEGTFSNVFLVKDGRVVTPSIETGILDGITRSIVVSLAKDLGMEVEERFVEVKEIFESDEIFLTHTSFEIVPVERVENKAFRTPGEITKKLMENFRRYAL